MKKVGKTTRSFRYDLNQIPYDYTVEVRNRFKGLYLIDRVPDELWTEVRDIIQDPGDFFSGAVSLELGRTSGAQLTGEDKTTWTGLCSVGEL